MLGLARFGEERKSFGWANAFRAYFTRLARRLLSTHVLECLVIESVSPKVTATDQKYRTGFLTAGELQDFAQQAELELSEAFLAESLDKGDECYGILDGRQLASYGWYSHGQTEIFPGFVLTFDRRYVYMYKGFTPKAYRGQRLHAVGMGRALNEYLSRGDRGIVSYVESDNLASLKSCERMGYRRFGRAVLVGIPGLRFTWMSSGCGELNFRVAAVSPHRAAEIEVGEPLSSERR